ncbi:GDSL-type esterase/lipase family protein [Oscillatoria sp. FACHB-1406]|uniref:GDSL-type esterase/lipase family protein n=1 Tax=Oscillatoria sp. FACHB-1406 TaxID=2692846 RepID=UPI001687E040|nr:GDSL-type esterase/lipase family protein [Oscillatoria sp. FACHB-1406]MBD2579457.1 G-D-S-L family lipolytic protein [Oscillatoria sp. FACHB-1406]
MQTLDFSSSQAQLSQPGADRALRVIALGDSLVYGYGDPDRGGWVEQLRRQWMLGNSNGHVLYNLGIRGDRAQQVTQRLEVEFRHRGELRNRLPDLILLSVGVNDSPRLGRPDGRNYTDFEDFQQQLSTLLDLAIELCPVLFVGMVPVEESRMPFLDCLYYNNTDQHRYKEVQRQACQKRNIPYLDIFDRWMARGESWRRQRLSADGLHPNSLGYQALFEDVRNWEALSGYCSPPVTF